MKNTKKIPSLIMLLGCSVAAVASYINHYTLEKMLITILWVLIVFYILGVIVKVLFDKYIPPEEEDSEISDEGSVIEKQVDDDGEYYTESEDEAEGSVEEISDVPEDSEENT